MSLSETILQFGSGKFLRAFADMFVHEANLEGQNVGRIVVVQSTGSQRADLLNARQGRYHVLIRGLQQGERVDETHEVTSVSRAIVADNDWEAVLDVARSPDLRFILSNTTEVGYNLHEEDRPDGVPRSFPGKLLLALKVRYEAGGNPMTVIPCELIDGNASRLRNIILDLAEQWNLGQDFTGWLSTSVYWLHTLVDRITSDPPDDHPLLKKDPLLTVTEPFAFWAIETHEKADPLFEHDAIIRTPDVRPYALRKVRILNGAHTALVCKALPMGIETVREAVQHPEVGPWLRSVIFDEIIPTLEGKVEGAEAFAEEGLERFQNPFLVHRLADIAWEHETKVKTRLIPTCQAYVEMFGREPTLLSEILGRMKGEL